MARTSQTAAGPGASAVYQIAMEAIPAIIFPFATIAALLVLLSATRPDSGSMMLIAFGSIAAIAVELYLIARFVQRNSGELSFAYGKHVRAVGIGVAASYSLALFLLSPLIFNGEDLPDSILILAMLFMLIGGALSILFMLLKEKGMHGGMLLMWKAERKRFRLKDCFDLVAGEKIISGPKPAILDSSFYPISEMRNGFGPSHAMEFLKTKVSKASREYPITAGCDVILTSKRIVIGRTMPIFGDEAFSIWHSGNPGVSGRAIVFASKKPRHGSDCLYLRVRSSWSDEYLALYSYPDYEKAYAFFYKTLKRNTS